MFSPKFVYHVDGQYGTWWDLFFTMPDPLAIQRAKVVNLNDLRR